MKQIYIRIYTYVITFYSLKPLFNTVKILLKAIILLRFCKKSL